MRQHRETERDKALVRILLPHKHAEGPWPLDYPSTGLNQ